MIYKIKYIVLIILCVIIEIMIIRNLIRDVKFENQKLKYKNKYNKRTGKLKNGVQFNDKNKK